MGSKIVIKKFKREIRELADKLPPMFIDMDVRRQYSGESLIMAGIFEVQEKNVHPDKMYEGKMPNGLPVNHFKKMVKLFEVGGMPRVQAYVDDVLEVAIKSHMPIQIGNFTTKTN